MLHTALRGNGVLALEHGWNSAEQLAAKLAQEFDFHVNRGREQAYTGSGKLFQ